MTRCTNLHDVQLEKLLVLFFDKLFEIVDKVVGHQSFEDSDPQNASKSHSGAFSYFDGFEAHTELSETALSR